MGAEEQEAISVKLVYYSDSDLMWPLTSPETPVVQAIVFPASSPSLTLPTLIKQKAALDSLCPWEGTPQAVLGWHG